MTIVDGAHSAAWGVFSGVASMLLYARLSPQQRLRCLSEEAAEVRKILANYEGDFGGALILARRNLQLSLRRLGGAIVPSLLASLPVVIALAFVRDFYVCYFAATAIAALLTKFARGIQ